MIFKHLPSHWRQFRSKFSAAPLELRAFSLFASITVFLDILMIIIKPHNIEHSISPYIGFGFSRGYGYALVFTSMLIFASHVKRKSIISYVFIIVMLGMPVLFEIYKLLHFQNNNFGNSYLTVSPWQSIWTVIIPLFWIGILLSGNFRKYCKLLDSSAI